MALKQAPGVVSAPAVAFDVTPLRTFRTGIGRSVEEMWAALRALPGGPRLVPYGLGLRAWGPISGLGCAVRSVRLPTRGLLALWSRTDMPRLDHWFNGTQVVHATNYVVAPSRRPSVVTVNDISFVLFPEAADRVVGTFPAMLRRAIARGVHVHVTTRYLAEEVDEHFGPGLLSSGRIWVVPFGIPDLGPPAGPPASLPAGVPYILALGSHQERKNLPRLIGAFGEMAAEQPELRLVIAGPEGPDTPQVNAAVALLSPALRRRVVVTGPVADGERRALLEHATVLAYPSLYEGFGLPPLEAMSLGVPVLAGRAGALPEVAGPGALLVDPLAPEEIAAGLTTLVGEEAERARLVASGRRQAAGFTWAATARGLADGYARLANSS